jgi:hypothetical protein
MDALRAQARALARSLYHYDFLHAQQAEASPALARGGLARRLACVEEQDEGELRQTMEAWETALVATLERLDDAHDVERTHLALLREKQFVKGYI